MTYRDKNEFSETINISSNIKDNKNTIIGKFDLKDILFILIAGVVGIGVLSVLLVVLSIRNMFVILLVLALFEVPIITLGFLKLHNIPVLDYIKMKNKSDNKSYRKQILKKIKSKDDKYILIFEVNCIRSTYSAHIARAYDCAGELRESQVSTGELCEPNSTILEEVISTLHRFIPYENIGLKIEFNKVFLVVEVKESFNINYEGLFNYLIPSNTIKFISYEDIKNYETYINSLKFTNKKYNKKFINNINRNKEKLKKLKSADVKINNCINITNDILSNKEIEYLRVIKIILYKAPFDINIFDKLKDYCSITSHISVKSDTIEFGKLSFVNTFLSIGGNEEEIATRLIKVSEILDENHILYKEINEEKVKDSLLFLLENDF